MDRQEKNSCISRRASGELKKNATVELIALPPSLYEPFRLREKSVSRGLAQDPYSLEYDDARPFAAMRDKMHKLVEQSIGGEKENKKRALID